MAASVRPKVNSELPDAIWEPFLWDGDDTPSSPSQNGVLGLDLSDAQSYTDPPIDVPPNNTGTPNRPFLSVAPEQCVDIGPHLPDSIQLWTPDPTTGKLVETGLCPNKKCKNHGCPVVRMSKRRGRPYCQIVFTCNPSHIRGRPKRGLQRTALLQWVPLLSDGTQGARLEADVLLKAHRFVGNRVASVSISSDTSQGSSNQG